MASKTSSVRTFLMAKAAQSRTPLSGTFELSPKCNMNCRMCYIRMTESEIQKIGRERTAEEWIALGKSCAEQGMLFLLLTGGEPFLRPDFRKIYTELKKLGLFLSINTNGTLLTADTIEWLSEDPPQILNITLYGASNDTYARLCGKQDGFDIVTSVIDNLLSHHIAVQINMSLTPDNIADLPEMIRFGNERNLPLKISSYMFPPVRKNDGTGSIDGVRFTEKECGLARFDSMRLQLPPDAFEALQENFRNGNLTVAAESSDCDLLGDGMECSAGRCSFWVTWDGRMMPCGMLGAPVTHPFETPFSDAWKKIVNAVNQITLPPECKNCHAKKVCRPCAAMVYAENGCFTQKPCYLCQSTAEYIRLMTQK